MGRLVGEEMNAKQRRQHKRKFKYVFRLAGDGQQRDLGNWLELNAQKEYVFRYWEYIAFSSEQDAAFYKLKWAQAIIAKGVIMNICLQAEIDWINANVHRYEGPWHAKAVIGNITKRYAMDEVKKLVQAYKTSRNTKDQLELFEWQKQNEYF